MFNSLYSTTPNTEINKQQPSMTDEDIEIPQAIAELANASTPSSVKNIRACKRCGILKTFTQFLDGKANQAGLQISYL